MKHALLTTLFVITTMLLSAQSVDQLIATADERLEHDDWLQASKDYQSILSKYQATLSPLQKANVYNNLGYLSMRLLNAEDAEYYLNLSLITHEEAYVPNKLDYASALQNMSLFFLQRVQFDLAKNHIDQAIEVIEQEKGRGNADYALARAKLAQIYEEVGYYGLAYEIFFESHETLNRLGAISPDYAEACNHMGRILIRQGQPAKAEEFFNESTVIYQQLGKDYDVERAESLEGLGNFYEQLGRYEEAEQILKEALEIKRSIPNEANILIIETLNDLGILYRHLGDQDRAKAMFQEVVQECEEELTTDHPFYATAKNNLATIAMQQGDSEDAKALLEEALATYDKKYGPNHPLSANTLNNLARVERQLGELDLAEEYYKRVLALDKKLYGENHPDYATTLINLAILYSSSGREDEAERHYKEALAIRKNVLGENHPSYLSVLENLGLHAIAVKRLDDAEQYFKEAIEIQIKQVRSVFPILTRVDQEIFYRRLRADVERYNFVAYGLLRQRPELVKNIFDFQIKTKSILFTQSDKIYGRVVNGSDQQLRKEFYSWQEDKNLLANYYQMGIANLEENSIDLAAAEGQVLSKERALISKMNDFDKIIPSTSEDWKSVQAKVKADEAVVQLVKIREFISQSHEGGMVFGFSNKTKYLAIIFSSASTSPSYVELGEGFRTDENLYFNYKRLLVGRDTENASFNLLWKPIHDKVGSVKHVKVAAEGVFHKVNPNLLQLPNGSFLIDEYFVSYLSSCKDLFREEAPALTKRTLLFGNPDFRSTSGENNFGLTQLPNSELEINSISGLLQPQQWETRVYSKQDATELRLRSAYNPTILHIATHGYFSSDQEFISAISRYDNSQFKSGLYLAGASQAYTSFVNGQSPNTLNDGILTTYETLGLDLNRTKLVVLSACETLLDEIDNNEGLYGLQRAFMVAGARNLITSLSKSNDQAQSELMVLFYHRFMETNEVAESLRFAQMKLRTKYSDPLIWGSFMLIGNG